MNSRSKAIAISLAITLFTMQGAVAAAKTSVTVKKAGRATTQPPNTILSGSGVPASSFGINGDFYIDIKNANLYGPKTNGAWKVTTSLKAPESKNTAVPTSGATGAVGAVGAVGAKGTTGDRGLNGATGPAGITGAKGETGLTGASGFVGPSGASGVQGPTGATGATGANGVAGVAGAVGVAGANGIAGVAGAVGVAGANGIAGATGATGAAGISNSYFVDIQQWTLSTSVNSGTSDSTQFGTLIGNGSYSFEIVLDGTFSPGTATLMSIGMQLIASVTPVSLQYRVFTSDSTSYINSVGGRHYQFLIIGTIVCSASTTSLTLRAFDQYGATASNMLSFSGKVLINKVGAIG